MWTERVEGGLAKSPRMSTQGGWGVLECSQGPKFEINLANSESISYHCAQKIKLNQIELNFKCNYHWKSKVWANLPRYFADQN